jgi:hypothetical protein
MFWTRLKTGPALDIAQSTNVEDGLRYHNWIRLCLKACFYHVLLHWVVIQTYPPSLINGTVWSRIMSMNGSFLLFHVEILTVTVIHYRQINSAHNIDAFGSTLVVVYEPSFTRGSLFKYYSYFSNLYLL